MFDSKMNEAKQARNMEGGKTWRRSQISKTFLTDLSGTEEESIVFEKKYLSLEDYDCIGFDLDHTLCRYNVGPMIRYPISRVKNIVKQFCTLD